MVDVDVVDVVVRVVRRHIRVKSSGPYRQPIISLLMGIIVITPSKLLISNNNFNIQNSNTPKKPRIKLTSSNNINNTNHANTPPHPSLTFPN